jgi:glycerol transport system ATP-binding protein
MSRIDLDLSHAYKPNPRSDDDYALLPLKMTFEDGGAYALLGPSGCGKTTLLNIVSGLVKPSSGGVRFDGVDVTGRTPQQRNIAQVFQFPVIYDTMTVAENLAFPLRNRGVAPARIKERVGRVAEMLELSGQLDARAAGLAADAKQKISLGRGLVREDVSAVLFDEPLTVIDPHLKWQLRRKLKQIHHELKLTLIYVTHDQVEALTFADQVMVMTRGRAVQVGSASDLFERPQHTFVGHFIGSPGMNLLPAHWADAGLQVAGRTVLAAPADAGVQRATLLGVRPEYVTIAADGEPGALPVTVAQAQDVGTYWLLTTRTADGTVIRARLHPHQAIPKVGDAAWLLVNGAHTCFYENDQLIAQAATQGALP